MIHEKHIYFIKYTIEYFQLSSYCLGWIQNNLQEGGKWVGVQMKSGWP